MMAVYWWFVWCWVLIATCRQLLFNRRFSVQSDDGAADGGEDVPRGVASLYVLVRECGTG
jgi:hypothetical protein